jgi:phosphoserine aminotransferase
MTRFIALFALWLLISATLSPPEKWKQVRVYVALCDNESQGIVPVPAKIGNGNDPDQNLYWVADMASELFSKNQRNGSW